MMAKINSLIRRISRKLYVGPQVKGAIVYLVRFSERDISDFEGSLKRLKKFFLDEFDYPVIAFHEADLGEETKRKVINETSVNVQFELIKFEIPKFLSHLEIPEKVGPAGNPIGYRHMCRFFTGAIYQQPALQEYDWYWRFDTDSVLLGKVDYDVFKFMAKNNLQYGYNRITHDPPSVVAGLGDATKKYIEDNNISPHFLDKFMQDGEWDRAMYYTNFEISKMSFWRSKEVVAFFDYLDCLGGIYTRRWGDAPIHLLMVSIFLPENQTHCFTDVPYRHHKCTVVPAKT